MLDAEVRSQIDDTRGKHEFLTFLVMENGDIRVGVVQNETLKMMMFYDFGKIRNEEDKREFLAMADEWWWESNQSIPVNAYAGDRFDKFDHALHGYPKKIVKEVIGPTFSLSNKYLKRIKKKKIEIISNRQPTARA